MARILVIDDDVANEFGDALRGQLEERRHEVHGVDMAEDGLRLLAAAQGDADTRIDLVLLDNLMPRMNGLEFLAALKERGIDAPPVILMTGASNADIAIQATKKGAFAYVIKPTDYDAILPEWEDEINRALKIVRPIAPVPIPSAGAPPGADDAPLVGERKVMLEVYRRIAEASDDDEPVLILGETGTGKDLVAQAIHTNSARRHKPFVVVNCPALTETLLESELFGHEKGAFTGADKMRKGHFEHAHGGTVFLDEVGDMPPLLQAKLLRVLQNREITRVGSSEPIKVDVRVLAATNRDMRDLVLAGKFRMDLFFRLEGMTIPLPPLRERERDVELLAERFLRQMCRNGCAPPALHPDAVQELRDHPFPGNIRQLINVMHRARRAVAARRGSQILPEDLDFGVLESIPSPPAPPAPAIPVTAAVRPPNGPADEDGAVADLRQAIAWYWNHEPRGLLPLLEELLRRELLQHAVGQRNGMSDVKLARRLGMVRNTMYRYLKEYGLKKPADGA